MNLDKQILFLLRDGRGLNENSLSEILAVTCGLKSKTIIEKIRELLENKLLKKDEELLKITSRGKRKLPRKNLKVSYQNPLFKRSWSMVVFDIPESQKKARDILRYRIKKEGFSLMQGSLWVSPLEPSEALLRYIRNKNLRWYVKILKFEMDKADEKEMIHRIWKLDKLNAAYLEFIEDAKKYFALAKNYDFPSDIIKLKALNLLAQETEGKYLEIVKSDPRLPSSLLPRDWQGKHAYKIYQQLDKYLD